MIKKIKICHLLQQAGTLNISNIKDTISISNKEIGASLNLKIDHLTLAYLLHNFSNYLNFKSIIYFNTRPIIIKRQQFKFRRGIR
ncbi:Uncharacterised protein [Legionella israelensis]|uniref:Uncharacterized protein n=1 Tax=Legionella israelensis TaxID=454 RepID=A0A0W0V2N0_9GAMM|nr:hypothetical protein Lisr_2604 [Legionella israelensis]SCY10863.1 hypothetical protein SAMN02746069_01310 [Legionella israelensis DSM 19235]STX59350.1 Uncharacterised protein [Legionella israelensis]